VESRPRLDSGGETDAVERARVQNGPEGGQPSEDGSGNGFWGVRRF